ncbi:hypothetical protein OPV22_028338 [Ensete ventricosum]|uniref:Uncharacterized protein n=1 Tax=Ensete ventricosum TaxID=4639 RepID=A0AAV8Q8B8_ENSVE|nr:hypothetical protein OPV22_028338 [Ensete ventricosum]
MPAANDRRLWWARWWNRLIAGITKNADVLFDEMPVKHLASLAVYGVVYLVASMDADLVSFLSSSSLVLRMGDVVSVKPTPWLACSGKCIARCYEQATEDLVTRSDS